MQQQQVALFFAPATTGKAMRESVTASKTRKWKKMSKEGIRLMTMWYKRDDKTPSEIAALLHHSKS